MLPISKKKIKVFYGYVSATQTTWLRLEKDGALNIKTGNSDLKHEMCFF